MSERLGIRREESGRVPGRGIRRAGGLPPYGSGGGRGSAATRVRRPRDRSPGRLAGRGSGRGRRRRVPRPARAVRGGRLHPGRVRARPPPVHGVRGRRLGRRDEQGAREAGGRLGGRAVRAGRGLRGGGSHGGETARFRLPPRGEARPGRVHRRHHDRPRPGPVGSGAGRGGEARQPHTGGGIHPRAGDHRGDPEREGPPRDRDRPEVRLLRLPVQVHRRAGRST